jgi:hypothetical protein
MVDFRLTQTGARRVLLAAQGLARPLKRPAGKPEVLDCIRTMGALQIDTISVVARSPYFVLYSRLGDYEPRWLEDHLAERALFEYWSHAACFLPIEDYPLYRRLQFEFVKGWFNTEKWIAEHPEAVARVLAHVRANGGARSSDFERADGDKGGWWNWKEEKVALEQLFNRGDLMIARREGFQRIYDLRERVMPDWDDADMPPLAEVQRNLTLKAVRALGVTPAGWAADYFRMKQAVVQPLLRALAAEGALLTGQVEGWDGPAYAHPDHRATLASAEAGRLKAERTALLSPFDPIVWDRARGVGLFNFDYKIECYTPAPKRRYGYFTLPILHRDRIVGRLDAKAHRKDGRFEVKALHFEPGVRVDEALAGALATTLRATAAWHKTPEVALRTTYPAEAGDVMAAALAAV